MRKVIFLVTAVVISSLSMAQDDQAEDTSAKIMDAVTFTANKYPKKQSETGKVITVIGRQQLDRSSGKNLGEILNTVAGTVIIGANNNLGTNQTSSIRGGSAGNVLILVDGIPANDPSVNNNYFDLNLFATEQVERIEILKGGQSTLYGSDAVSGVINIITRKNQTKPFSLHATLAGGSYNTFKQHIGIGGKAGSLSYSAAYTHLSSEGFTAANDATKTGGFDDDAFDQHVANSILNFTVNPRLSINVNAAYSFYDADLDAAAFSDEKDYTVKNDNFRGGTGFSWSHSRGALKFNYAFNYVERDYWDDSMQKGSPYLDWAKSRYIGRSHFVELYNSWQLTNWELLAGADYRLNNTDQFYRAQFPPFMVGFPPSIYETSIRGESMSQVSPYASFVYKHNGFTGEIGGRLNFHSEYGTNFSFTLNPSYRAGNVKLFANLYSAFKTPTLYQLFDPSAGNVDLDPERGIIGELGAEVFTAASLRGRVTGFYRNTSDAIVYTFNPSTYESLYANVSEQQNYGVEMELGYAIDRWKFDANYTYTDGEIKGSYDNTGVDIGKDTSYYNLYRIPKHAFNFRIECQATSKLFLSTQLRVVGKRDEFVYGGAGAPLDSYATIDVYGEYAVARIVKLFVDLKNITNKEYFELQGYNSRRFNFMAGLQVRL